MPGPAVVPVAGDPALPARVDVAVVGGGIVGAATALELAERGLRVALIEKGCIAGEQSSRNWGWVRISRRDPREIALMACSLRLWRDMDRRVGGDTGYRRCGIVFACADEAAQRDSERWLGLIDGLGIDARMATADEARALLPGFAGRMRGALVNRDDGRAEPQQAAAAIAEGARAKGTAILTGCAARTLEFSAGRVSAVATERGRIACDAVVVAGGVWSRAFLRNAGVVLPQLRVRNSALRTAPVDGGPDMTLKGDGFAVRRREDGGYTVASLDANPFEITPEAFRQFFAFLPALRSEWRTLAFRLGPAFVAEAREPRRWGPDDATPFERTRVLDPHPDAAHPDRALAWLAQVYPVFRGARVVQRWAGMIDVTPDAVPVVSAVDGRPGLFVATGFSGHGFGIGPGAGRLAADLVTGAPPVVDSRDFRLSRFTDGSRIEVLAGY